MPTPSDRHYKLLFSHPLFVRRLLEGFVDEPFVKQLDYRTLTRVNARFVTPQFAERESDVIWRISFRSRPIYIFLLIEFQSSVDRWMPLRFLRYVAEFYQSLNSPAPSGLLPAVFPVLIYNGNGPWTARTSIQELIEPVIPPQYIPALHYYPVIENTYSRETLLRLRSALSAVFYVENLERHQLLARLDEIVAIIQQEHPQLRALFWNWLSSVARAREESADTLAAIQDAREVKTMFAASVEAYEKKLKAESLQQGLEQGLEKGLEKGIEQGRQQGIEQGEQARARQVARRLLDRGFSVAETADLAGLSEDEVRKLVQE
ncbi:MAG: Rpn family recombination-promoting nuclease/putative transposase [Spirochaetaceae bacterium]|nr:MAG: Rpn family recombination-promoting nuclease/putative transposase [Spirochaetaceae bacterium]